VPVVLEPLVAGELGDATILDTSTHPPIPIRVQYVLDEPSDEDIIESFPVYLVSNALGAALEAAELSGFRLADAETLPSDNYKDLWPDVPHKAYRWLQVLGPPTADCWIGDDLMLVVSDRMYAVIAEHDVAQLKVTRI
jgi:hypothetical protein